MQSRDSNIAAMSGGYDARGNLANEGTAPGKRAFTYDAFNRLLTVADGGTPTVYNLKLTYDPEGRLARYSTDGGTS